MIVMYLVLWSFNYLLFLLFITGDTIKQGFKPKSIHYIEVGMKVLFFQSVRKLRGTVKFVGPGLTNFIGVELDPCEGEYRHMNVEMY